MTEVELGYLDKKPEDEAGRLLTFWKGKHRKAGEPIDIEKLVDICGGEKPEENFVEELAKQLHEWYLEATEQEGSKYNHEAVVPYEDLTEGSKLLDRYIARKVADLLQRHEAHVREKAWKEVVDRLHTMHEVGEDAIVKDLISFLKSHS